MKTLKILLLLAICIQTAVWAQPTDNPIASYYQQRGETWPGWTDDLFWTRTIDMSTYPNGANDFEKFENARDQLAALGGGVLYYPAGTYFFNDHPKGKQGRGLMLRKGVVIRGEAPTTDIHANKDSANAGLTTLGTTFVFPFNTKFDVDGNLAEYPDNWNMIGLMPEPGGRISGVTHVGIAWVKLVGAVVYFGGDQQYSPTYGQATNSVMYRNLKRGPNFWEDRVPDGTHWLDPFMGASKNDYSSPYIKGGEKRFVFGCRLEDSAPTDDVTNAAAGYSNFTWVDTTAINPFRYTGRIGVYGAHLFIANNAIPASLKSFRHEQLARERNRPARIDTILYDYGCTIGIDVNKSLASQYVNRCNLKNGPFYEQDIIIQDNWVYNHGNKAYEFAGKWVVVKRNTNARDYLQQNAPFLNVPGGWHIAIDGFLRANQIDDNMSRFMDFGGWNLWMDSNWWNNTGSDPGNDGEGMLIQRHGAVEAFSYAYTNNGQGPDGELAYLSVYNVHTFGLLQYNNRIRGQVGTMNSRTDTIADVACVFNRNRQGQPITAQTPNARLLMDFLNNCNLSAPTPPAGVNIEPDTSGTAMVISYQDNTTEEFGYLIERRMVGTPDWVTVAYRPRDESNTVWDYYGNDNGNRNLDCRVGPLEMNPTEWFDFLAPRNVQLEYRVTALDCNMSQSGSSPATPATGVLTNVPNRQSVTRPVVWPNPAKNTVNISWAAKFSGQVNVSIINTLGQVVYSESLVKEGPGLNAQLNTSSLGKGLHKVVLQTANGQQTTTSLIIE